MTEYQLLREAIKEKNIFITDILEELKGVYNELSTAKQATEKIKSELLELLELLEFLDKVKNNEQS